MSDLFDPTWRLAELDVAPFGEFAPPITDDAAKAAVWKAYHDGRPTRTPVLLATNNRVALLDRRIDSGLDFRQVFASPEAMLRSMLLWQYVCRMRYHCFCDWETALPDRWCVGLHFQNVFEAWFFGCPVDFHDDQVPDTTPILTDANKRSVFDVDIDRPFDRDPFRREAEFHETLVEFVRDKTFLDRPIDIQPPSCLGTDGPLTVAMNVRGPDILMDMVEDPAYADELFAFLTDAAIKRRRAFVERYQLTNPGFDLADDSIALISTAQYRQMLLPHHRRWYEAIGSQPGQRGIHLCGDASRHFRTIRDELGVTTFDTGFPIDFARIRRALGPAVQIQGGVEIGLLMGGSPQQVYDRSREILTSGVRDGRRFIFREANNLPPNVPWVNLAAMYRAAHDFGRFD